MKKKLGIVGGMGSHAAAWLFKRIVDLSYGQKDQEYIEILLHNNTAVPDRTRAIVYDGESPLPELIRSIQLFNQAEVEVAAMACLTAYYYKSEVSAVFHGDLIDPVELTMEAIREQYRDTRGLCVGIIATTGTLRSGIFQKALSPLGIKAVSLQGREQEHYFMRPVYMEGGAKSGNIRQEAFHLFEQQVPLLKRMGAQVIIGACSEVPLLLSADKVDIPYVDVFSLLARKLVDICYCVS